MKNSKLFSVVFFYLIVAGYSNNVAAAAPAPRTQYGMSQTLKSVSDIISHTLTIDQAKESYIEIMTEESIKRIWMEMIAFSVKDESRDDSANCHFRVLKCIYECFVRSFELAISTQKLNDCGYNLKLCSANTKAMLLIESFIPQFAKMAKDKTLNSKDYLDFLKTRLGPLVEKMYREELNSKCDHLPAGCAIGTESFPV